MVSSYVITSIFSLVSAVWAAVEYKKGSLKLALFATFIAAAGAYWLVNETFFSASQDLNGPIK